MAWFQRLINVFRSEALRSEIDEELRYHIEARAAENFARGMSRQEAQTDALRRFGGRELKLDEAHDADTLAWLETIFQDLRYGIRMLRRTPGFTTVGVLSIALGIGANVAIFSLIYALLLRWLPIPDPQNLILDGSALRRRLP